MIGVLDSQMKDHVLENNVIGRLGYMDGEKIYIIPVSYYYFNKKYIIIHSREGKKIDILRKYPHVCFEVEEIDNMNNYRVVLIWGTYEELTDPKERYYALNLLIRRLQQHKLTEDDAPESTFPIPDDLVIPDREKAIVYRIKIEEKSGRLEKNNRVARPL